MIPTKLENPKGLHGKYYIQKVIGYQAYFDVPKPGYYSKYPARELRDISNIDEVPEGQPIYPVLVDVDKDSEYFVLRLDNGASDINHLKACRIGVNAYADAIADFLPELAKDLKERYPLIEENIKDESI